MSNTKNSFSKIRKEIDDKQKKIILLELIDENSKYNGIDSIYGVKREYRLDFDLKNSSLIFLFDDMLDDLIACNFKIDLKIYREKAISEKIEKIRKIDSNCAEILELRRLYGRMCDSYDNISNYYNADSIDIIKLLLDSKQSELIVKLIISNKVKDETKRYIVNQIINSYPNLIDVFNCVPTSFIYIEGADYNDVFKNVMNENLQKILDDKSENNMIFRTKFNKRCADEIGKYQKRDLIRFFIDRNLVDTNDIHWRCDEYPEITSAAAGYFSGDFELGKYIYSLEENSNIDKKVRNDSDMVILKVLFRENKYEFFDFLNNPNFKSSPEKFDLLVQEILESQKSYSNNTNTYDIYLHNVEKTINIVLRKTTKEDYKKIKKAIEDLRINMNMESKKEKREKLIIDLKKVSESLLEQVPAKTKINDIRFKKDINK